MKQLLTAIGLYFGIVFGAGFLLGPIRVLWLEPKFGPLAAVAIEAPFLLAAMVLGARWCPRAVGVEIELKRLAAIGVGALALQQVADLGIGVLRGISLADQWARLATPEGRLYIALLIQFAAMPIIANKRLV